MKQLLVATAILGGLFTALHSPAEATPAHAAVRADRPHTACVTEDSAWCVWVASGPGSQGNHQGHSFWSDRANRVHYVPAGYARQLLGR